MIVEDGSGMINADSYVSVEFADDYFSSRGVALWSTLSAETKEQCLIRATDYIDNVFQWCGRQVYASQSLRFPRLNLKDYEGNPVEGIPLRLKQAVCDASVALAGGDELFEKSEQNGDVVSESITSLSFTYSKTERKTVSKTLFDSINTKLRGLYFDSSRASIQMGRMHR